MSLQVGAGDFQRLSRASDAVREGMHEARGRIDFDDLVPLAMPGGEAGKAARGMVAHLRDVHLSIANAAGDVADAAELAEQDFQQADEADAQRFAAIEQQLDAVPHDGYGMR